LSNAIQRATCRSLIFAAKHASRSVLPAAISARKMREPSPGLNGVELRLLVFRRVYAREGRVDVAASRALEVRRNGERFVVREVGDVEPATR
jgi:hypothetical protein